MKNKLSLQAFVEYCMGKRALRLSPHDEEQVRNGRSQLEDLEKLGNVYGVHTQVGALVKEGVIKGKDPGEFQRQLLMSHASGTGPYLPREEARGMIVLLVNMWRQGYSGVSLETMKHVVNFFNRGSTSAIPEQGSLGASGDLVPQAHAALPFIGQGHVLVGDTVISTSNSGDFVSGKVRPIELKSGEGLAFINGTHMMTSLLAWTVFRSLTLVKTADIIGALSGIALCINPEAFREEVHKLRPYQGQQAAAGNIEKMLMGFQYSKTLQDAYSLRCMSQVHGPVKEVVNHAKEGVKVELNSVSGNPLFIGGEVVHGGNFHGHPLALRADYLAIALTTLAGISERRIERLVNPALSNGLIPFLADLSDQGDCGMMIPQYVAASLVSENKTLSHPASVDSIPTSAAQEDYVSMGAWAVRKLRTVHKNTEKVLAIELLSAIRALELRGVLSDIHCPRFLTDIAIAAGNQKDRSKQSLLSQDVEHAWTQIRQGKILEIVENELGSLE